MPATYAFSECSFSSLHRITSYLKATITQMRLNSVMMLQVYNNHTDDLCLTNVTNEFVRGSEHWEIVFGNALPSD